MAIPPFPSQDLAKLVLGYLAEEQLMTAYDEFLQASPYLDALRNEYDRIFMTSLKNILAEYRAVKIYIETCKPYLLRKQLFQCTNLLEVVKYLIQHVDINKIQGQDGNNGKTSVDVLNSSITSRRNRCEVCNSINLTSCSCKLQNSSGQYSNQSVTSDKTTLQNSVETTSLTDLPGNYVTARKKYVKVLEKEPSSSYSNCGHNETIGKPSLNINSDQNLTNTSLQIKNYHNNMDTQDSMQHFSSSRKVGLESSQKIEEFNEILNKVCANNSAVVGKDKRNDSESDVNKSIFVVPTFQDFSAGVRGVNDVPAVVPDSSTSKTDNNLQLSLPKETSSSQSLASGHIEANSLKSQNGNKSTAVLQSNTEKRSTNIMTGNIKLRPKLEDHRIRILSNIKVDSTKTKSTNTNVKVFPILKNSTSTPLLQMQTIYINGTPAYKPNSQSGPYTKDEIMAMPTIILIPNSGPPVSSTSSQPKTSLAQNTTPICSITSGDKLPSLEPLTIDISDSPEPANNNFENGNILQNVQNVSITRENAAPHQILHHTAPKNDATVKISTPQILPLARKSSSTPRRTSHVRVLDFTTPRRILHETISEQHSNGSGVTESSIADITANKQLLVATNVQEDTKAIKSKQDNSSANSKRTKEIANKNNIPTTKKHNWDSDLRALVVSKTEYEDDSSSRVKPKMSQKKKLGENKNKGSLSKNKKTLPKSKTNKKNKKKSEVISEEESVEVVEKVVDIAVKPTINIISDRTTASHQENDKVQNTSNYEEVNTPDIDRLSLHNAIDAKLNISDLLETPYKQALYEIQMETPRFLNPDIPIEPMSDIKITNIPTPRFLTTPNLPCTSNPAQATPSSYSSRPTDYSSGGSYYKPDDQDYLRISEDVSCSVQSSKSMLNLESPKKLDDDCSEKNSPVKSSRPVRQCRKNVCYYNTSSSASKSKDCDYKIESASYCSDSINICSPHENKDDKEKFRVILSDNKAKAQNKSASKRRVNISKRKSPLKKVTSKNFMKIKPRRLTPSKENLGKRKSKENELKEKIGNKEKLVSITPSIASVPTKSRRKSSTPRKLQQTSTTKTYHSEASCIDTSETPKSKKNDTQNVTVSCVQDSDTEQIALRWSDDGTQDCKQKDVHTNISVNDSEDISKIQEYIQTTEFNKPVNVTEIEDSLQKDLIKRGFDAETAKIIERDLLDTPSYLEQPDESVETKINKTSLNRTVESDCSTSTNLQIIQEDGVEDDQLELSVHECNEGSDNYIVFGHDDTEDVSVQSPLKFKDTFSMEVCIDDDVCIRLRAMPFISLLDHNLEKDENDVTKYKYDCTETEAAVASICRSEMVYTPIKEATKAQCYEIFDSTLTSIDTPLKQNSPKTLKKETSTVTEIVLEVEQIIDKVELKEKTETKKRKRIQSESSSDESLNDIKKAKSETQYLLNSASIQNIDIESVLSKLHGP